MGGGYWVAYFTKDGGIILVDLILSLSLPDLPVFFSKGKPFGLLGTHTT